MSGRVGVVKANGSTGSVVKTLIQILAAANHPATLIEVGISFKGVVNTDPPILVEILRASDDGTGDAYTVKPGNNELSVTFDTTAKLDYSVEPVTPGDVLRQWLIHPQVGYDHQLHDLAGIVIGAGTALALRVTAADNVIYAAYMSIQE